MLVEGSCSNLRFQAVGGLRARADWRDGTRFEINVSHDGLRTLLEVTGRIDHYAVPALRAIEQTLVEPGKDAVIDLAGVTSLDAAGFASLTTIADRLSNGGHEDRIVGRSSR